MAIEVKICGINSAEALAAAVEGGAGLIGFNFYRKSPRFLTHDAAAALARTVPAAIKRVGLIVDLDNEAIATLLAAVPLDMLQLHGSEDPTRVAAVRARFRKPVMKAIPVARAEDLAIADAYLPVADRLLFDAKPPPSMKDALPGGNAISFDWRLLQGHDWPKPWMLSGGLRPSEGIQELSGTHAGRLLVVAEETAQQDQVLQAREVLVDGGVLAGEADPAADLVGLADDVVAEDVGLAAVGAQQGGEHLHGGGLAGAVRAEDAVDRAGRHRQVDSVDGPGLTERLHEARGLDRQG